MLEEYVKFYYSALDDKKKEIYKVLYNAFRNKEKDIRIYVDPDEITIKDINDIAIAVYNDTPSFYYLDLSHYSYIELLDGFEYTQEYIYTDEQIAKFGSSLMNGLEMFKRAYIREGMSDYEKELAIHDYLVKTIKYDYDAIDDNKPRIDEAFNILGALIKKKAVCWGIACAFKLLCDYCKVKCFVVVGNSIPSDGDSGHAWNIVKIENKEYHVDVTWDLRDKGDISFCYDYFNLDDHLIKMNHTWDNDLYPVCNGIKYNYYYRNKLFVKDISEIKNFVKEKLKQNETYIAFKFANDMPSKEKISQEISEGFMNAFKFNSYAYLISEKTHNIYIELQ